MAKILIVDDEVTSLMISREILQSAGYETVTLSNSNEALKKIKEIKFDVLLTDFNMPGMNGIELTKEVLKTEPEVIVIFITAFGSISSAVEAMKIGAFDYLTKPIQKDELLHSVRRGIEKLSLLKENELLKQKLEKSSKGEDNNAEYLTSSEKLKELLKEAKKVSKSDATILITGENGTGKEVFAKYLYNNSSRKDKPFVTVNSAAISEQLLESELFGHVKGSFTGAVKDKKGYFEVADNGTIFLDEIGEISTGLQVKLLRVLQEREFCRVGDTQTRTTNVRIIAATNQNLVDLINEGKFREDLYYRLNVFELRLPALRERPEDIMFYFEKFVNQYAMINNKEILAIDEDVREALSSYRWPGNIRELKNFAERVTILADGKSITSELLPSRFFTNGNDTLLNSDYNINKEIVIRNFEINFLRKYLRLNKGNVAATARAINFHPVSLRQKLAKLGINSHN
jgi:DNA-binding NtrC family response regulator